MERELAKRENEMGSPVDKTVWARDKMSFREDIKILCHRVNGLGELRAALLVDATCVDPPPFVSEAGRELAEFDDFGAQSTLEIW